METVTSRDGTTLAYDRLGEGPPVVLVSGGSTDRMANAGLAAQLAANHTVYNFDRRGRGDSGDTQPYAIEREIEDITAVIEAAGGSANLYGTSSGAALAMHAAAAGAPVTRLARAGVAGGDEVEVDLELDTASREVTVPGAGCASAPRLSSPACRTPGRLAPACPSAAPRPRAGWSSAWTTTAARPS
jgi:pimeloyl-ACP methyl ester carboxylesterase